MIGNSVLRPGRAALVAVLLAAVASMAFARGSMDKGGAAAGTGPVAVVQSGPGVLVVAVLSGSPAEKAGIVRGDIILSADGKDISNAAELQRTVASHKAGDSLSLKIKHGDAEKTLSVTLADSRGRAYLGVEPYAGRLGMMTAPFELPEGQNIGAGALVASVVSGAPADKAGIKKGDLILSVDGTAISPQNDLSSLMGKHKPGDAVTLSVQSSGQQQPRDVKVTLGANPQKADAAYLGIQYSLSAERFGMAPFMQGPMGNGMYNRRFWGQANPGSGQVVQGIMVEAVADNGPAAQAGLKARDVITAIDGVTVYAPRQVVDTVAGHKAGDKLTVTVYRFNENKSTDLTVTLAAPPAGSSQTGAYMGITMSRYMGATGPETNEPQTGAPSPAAPQPLEKMAPSGQGA